VSPLLQSPTVLVLYHRLSLSLNTCSSSAILITYICNYSEVQILYLSHHYTHYSVKHHQAFSKCHCLCFCFNIWLPRNLTTLTFLLVAVQFTFSLLPRRAVGPYQQQQCDFCQRHTYKSTHSEVGYSLSKLWANTDFCRSDWVTCRRYWVVLSALSQRFRTIKVNWTQSIFTRLIRKQIILYWNCELTLTWNGQIESHADSMDGLVCPESVVHESWG